ncbi:butyrophilin subfamily 1 member A1-like [Megalops cyprinoides]|uniref:butyrophilin subfamily 1 member A1-like n=1 Tax=Megalops cyprinoides TaxID=118141 RepID=UPI001863F0F8|nr:butyrophilin subfamily 1 member A1-like [Megalops cyprinoides]
MFQVFGPAHPVVADVAEDVVLPCYLNPNISAEDMRVEWFRPDSTDRLVHLYQEQEIRNEDQIPSYRGRTALFPEELKKGNTSLRLAGVRASDEGRYKCFIQSLQWYDDASVKVEVRGTEPLISMEGHREWGIGLLCESKGWDLQPELIWLDSEGHSLPAGPTETHRDSMDLLIVRRRIIIQDRDTKRVTCRVQLQQRSLEKETEFHITGYVRTIDNCEVILCGIKEVSLAVPSSGSQGWSGSVWMRVSFGRRIEVDPVATLSPASNKFALL